jgi:DNA (cytosine-5)-methyltransferase 1
MENVPDMMNQAGHNIAGEIVELLDRHGYVAKYGLVNTAFYGVPQMRDRVFIIAYRRELGITPELPNPTRHLQLPSGYHGTRSVALKYVDLLSVGTYLSPRPNPDLPYAVTVEEAIGDLPPIDGNSVKLGARRPGPKTFVRYRQVDRLSRYAQDMREWPGFEATDGVEDHLIRFLPRDGHIFAAMPEGAQYPEARELAVRLFEKEAAKQGLRPRTKAWTELQKKMVPPYRTDTFPNRWWKLIRDRPCRTLMAHLGKDCYSHIHYDGTQRRTISIREAARLQSFPDGFKFAGTMNPAMRQIGNAVPPLMSFEIAKLMRTTLESAASR